MSRSAWVAVGPRLVKRKGFEPRRSKSSFDRILDRTTPALSQIKRLSSIQSQPRGRAGAQAGWAGRRPREGTVPSRLNVFLAGFSMGGLFTNFTACDHPDWFRAYAPVEGMGPGGSQDGTKPLSCANADAKPAIMIHQGSADTSVPPAQGQKTRDFWATQNGCSQTTTASFAGCQSYSACAQPVIYCSGSWDHNIDPQAVSNIWSFFSGL